MTAIGKGIDTTGYVFERAGDFARAKPRLQVADCPDCRGSGLSRGIVEENGRKYDVVTPCMCMRLARRAELFNAAHVPARYAEVTIASYQVKEQGCGPARDAVRDFVRSWPSARGFILSGPVGSGKSHLLAATVKYLTIEFGVACEYVELSHLYQTIRRGFQEGRSGGEIIQPLAKVEVVALDELGKGRGSAFELDTLDELVSRRYNAGKVTLFATNYGLREPERLPLQRQTTTGLVEAGRESKLLSERVGARMFSRLLEMCDLIELPNSLPDARKTLGQAFRRRA